ncbi:5-(carboxyamino)imidazole ribonucleotide synthase [Aeromonas hydrophila]|uniref:N5-carboxyaminoimidazole ribonucleotide synthase n=1 Tax=Aeromonas hydrophila subsp. hydrophila (strain ATCC 7966 / DSM 30187 / BCRC 13018 / CCUG 14551 / JCM 1027 / KCTC 2358 / NCIMB 9240 / NCTC 8049) TaxID=380703 RepID=A0KEE1_AERHH|nr:5-(carboxyamino)imidazole ribonucleotide synthase [Aeromonas hydrophila]ABK37904.1 phosphoribosylaminoimidazole carboxylase, ATPase subunit [Aeromonas hydrophila subsp. hydrophila ATCC 7966]MBS4673905.1 5-(carboxyamino)imidazole ribonucleotide synthase [Aeromonas hydrophila]OOD32279.1 5-(carboxyamino)imidazole ribonucleotide synthase [Aeromonas hydrophila]SUU11940.1 phosphoribosylaminoimidazole carboxylase ATPase subunit [Aeromonas hydrophila]HEG4447376.1 5-(carboxyamino)imidazole ribonucle
MILPPATLGMLGGGQLGRYFVMAAHRLGYKVVVLDPDPASIAGAAADHHIVAAYDDPTALHDLASRCAAVTCEFENVPATALALLEQYQPVRPAAGAVRICQDRREEKAFLSRAGIPVAPNQTLLPGEPLPALPASLFPAILKTAREGYDGKGQWTIQAADQLPAALAASGVPCVLEQRLALEGEFSLTLARSPSGAIGALPLVQNWHSGGILDQTRSPANVPALEADARRIAEQLIAALDYVGVLTVELFLVAGKLLVNELAPRPHNSGHPSLDNAECSQFELQVRALCDLPLPSRIAVRPAMLLNLLGDLWQAGTPDWAALLALPGVHLHLYGKGEPRPGRKMGHVTITAADWPTVEETCQRVRQLLGLPPR